MFSFSWSERDETKPAGATGERNTNPDMARLCIASGAGVTAHLHCKELQQLVIAVISHYIFFLFVGVAGFEPTTPSTPRKCATRLRYTPMHQ